MQAVVFCGIQGTGKSSFYRERFFKSHVRINLDMLKTRHRELLLLRACLEGKQPFVVDNTNPAIEERAQYLAPARAAGFRIIGYYFASGVSAALARNASRPPDEQVPVVGLLGTRKRLQLPSRAEGFDELWYVKLTESGFEVQEWRDDVR